MVYRRVCISAASLATAAVCARCPGPDGLARSSEQQSVRLVLVPCDRRASDEAGISNTDLQGTDF